MVQRLKRMRKNLRLSRRNRLRKYHKSLIEKSYQLYNELLENKIIPEMESETDGQLALDELNWFKKWTMWSSSII